MKKFKVGDKYPIYQFGYKFTYEVVSSSEDGKFIESKLFHLEKATPPHLTNKRKG